MDQFRGQIALSFSKIASGKSDYGEDWEVHKFNIKKEIFTLIVGSDTEEFSIDEIGDMILKALSLGIILTSSQLGIGESDNLD